MGLDSGGCTCVLGCGLADTYIETQTGKWTHIMESALTDYMMDSLTCE